MSTATAAADPSATASGRGKAGFTSTSTSTSTTSAARIEANRRNAQKSTGPRTQAGKDRSRFNALRHGLRSTLPVLPGEDESILKNRLDSWTATLAPRDDVERYLVERAVNVSLQLDRADRAWAARLEVDRLTGGAANTDAQADEVVRLGRRLFWDPRGPLALYPFFETMLGDPPRCSWMPEVDDPLDPARLVGQLESSALGCAWLLDRWRELRELLEDGLAWQAPDRFKAIRLLGRQPLDAAADDRVLAVYLHSHAIEPEPEWPAKPGSGPASPFADILIELQAGEQCRFAERVAARIGRFSEPMDAEAGRAYLLDLTAEQEGRLEEILASLVERDVAAQKLRGNFEETDLGERLRRYQISCNRTILRILDILRRRHREADGSGGRWGAASGRNGTVGRSDGPVGPTLAADLASDAPASHAAPASARAETPFPAATRPSPREKMTNEPNPPAPAVTRPPGSGFSLAHRSSSPATPAESSGSRPSPGEKTTNEPNPPAPAASRLPGFASSLAARPSSNATPERPLAAGLTLVLALALVLPVLQAAPAAGRPGRGGPEPEWPAPSARKEPDRGGRGSAGDLQVDLSCSVAPSRSDRWAVRRLARLLVAPHSAQGVID